MKETKVWRRAYQEKKYEGMVQSQVKERSGMDGWERKTDRGKEVELRKEGYRL